MTQSATLAGIPASQPLAQLTEEIEHTHHQWVREIMDSLDQLTAGIAAVWAEEDPRLLRVRELFSMFRQEMTLHLLREERVLFPIIRELEDGGAADEQESGPVSISCPIQCMTREHEALDAMLAELGELTDGFSVPAGASADHRLMIRQLDALASDTREHVRKEDQELFPAALALARHAAA